MKHTLSIIFFFLACNGSEATEINSAISAEIKSIASTFTDGPATLYDEGIQVVHAPILEGKELIDTYIALFYIEGFGGGNGGRQYLAIFKRNSKEDIPEEWPFHEFQLLSVAKVGQDYDRIFEKISAKGNAVTLEGKKWVNDAHCCPSGKSKAKFIYNDFNLTEANAANK